MKLFREKNNENFRLAKTKNEFVNFLIEKGKRDYPSDYKRNRKVDRSFLEKICEENKWGG